MIECAIEPLRSLSGILADVRGGSAHDLKLKPLLADSRNVYLETGREGYIADTIGSLLLLFHGRQQDWLFKFCRIRRDKHL
jgi:hypothetical protein